MGSYFKLENLLGISPGGVYQGPPVVFSGTTLLISRVVVLACNHISSGGVFLFLHILSSTCYLLRFLVFMTSVM